MRITKGKIKLILFYYYLAKIRVIEEKITRKNDEIAHHLNKWKCIHNVYRVARY